MAKRFMFVSLGILALALAFHLGETGASATTGTVDVGLPYYCGNAHACTAAVIGRTFYENGAPFGPPIPGTAKASWMGQATNNDLAVMLDNGDTYVLAGDPYSWVFVGNAVGGVTPALRATWGAVKAKYHN